MSERLPRRVLVRDGLVLGAVVVLYTLGRYLIIPSETTAVGNAEAVFALEGALHLDIEPGVQRWLGLVPGLLGLVQAYYLLAHPWGLAAVMAAVALWRPGHWPMARNVWIAVTVAGFVLHVLYPLAPPRLTPGAGITDTLVDGGTGELRHGANKWFNPYAAFPSLHTASALVVAGIVSVAWSGTRAARLVWLHPLVMAVTVMATGNHWTVDVLGALAIVVPAVAMLRPGGTAAALEAAPEAAR